MRTNHKCRVSKIDYGYPLGYKIRMFNDRRWTVVCDDCREGTTYHSWSDALNHALIHWEARNSG